MLLLTLAGVVILLLLYKLLQLRHRCVAHSCGGLSEPCEPLKLQKKMFYSQAMQDSTKHC